jgi:hypothetical protein
MSPATLLIVAAGALGVLALVALAKFVLWLVTRD